MVGARGGRRLADLPLAGAFALLVVVAAAVAARDRRRRAPPALGRLADGGGLRRRLPRRSASRSRCRRGSAAPPDLLRGLVELLAGAVLAWKDLVTVDLPVGSYRNLLVPALVVFLVGTCAALAPVVARGPRRVRGGPDRARAWCPSGCSSGAPPSAPPLPIGPVVLYAPRRDRARHRRPASRACCGSPGAAATSGCARSQRAATSSGVRVLAAAVRGRSAPRRARRGHGRGRDRRRRGDRPVRGARRRARRAARRASGPTSISPPRSARSPTYRACFADARADEVLFTVAAEERAARRACAWRRSTATTARSSAAAAPARVDEARFVRVPAALDAGAGDARRRCRSTIDSLDGIWMPTAGRLASVEFDGDRAAVARRSASTTARPRRPGVADGGRRPRAGRRLRRLAASSRASPDARRDRARPACRRGRRRCPRACAPGSTSTRQGSGGAALAGLVALLRERGYLSHALSMGATPARVGAGAARLRVPAERLRAFAGPHRRDVRAPARARVRSAGRGIRQLRRRRRRRRAVRASPWRSSRRSSAFPPRVVLGARLSSPDPALPACDDGACRAQDLAAWTEVQSADGDWVPIDVDPAVRSSRRASSHRAARPRERHRGAARDSSTRSLPPDPVQQDSAPDDAPPDDAGGSISPGCGRRCGSPAIAAARARARVRAVPRRRSARRPRGGVAPAQARTCRPRGSPAAGTNTWMPPIDAGRDAPARAHPHASSPRSTRRRPARGSPSAADRAVFSAARRDRRRRRGLLAHRRRGAARPSRASAGSGAGSRATVSLRSFVRHLAPVTGRSQIAPPRGGCAGSAASRAHHRHEHHRWLHRPRPRRDRASSSVVVLYVWIGLALVRASSASAGEEAWKGWVPILNLVVAAAARRTLRLAAACSCWCRSSGLSLVWVVHRHRRAIASTLAFGYGAGHDGARGAAVPGVGDRPRLRVGALGRAASRAGGGRRAHRLRRTASAPPPLRRRLRMAARGSAACATGRAAAAVPPAAAAGPPPAGRRRPRPPSPIRRRSRVAASALPPVPTRRRRSRRRRRPVLGAGLAFDDESDWTGEVTGAVHRRPRADLRRAAPAAPPASRAGPLRADRDRSPRAPTTRRRPSRACRPRRRWPRSRALGARRDRRCRERRGLPRDAPAPVSAIAGAPDAGGPRSARASVSAQHVAAATSPTRTPSTQTIIARRQAHRLGRSCRRSGAPIPLTAEVVILGRRPVADPAFPDAQLVARRRQRTISKTHARLELRDDRWYITDLDSTNGVLFATLMGTEVDGDAGRRGRGG